MLYTPWLCSLDYVRQHRRLQESETDDDELLRSLIAEASAEFIESGLMRVPMPYVATKSFGPDHLRNSLDLELRDDLLAATTITNGDDSTVSSSVYDLRPDNVYPKRRVELKSSSGSYWRITYREDRISIAGLWGYVPQYATGAFLDSTINVPAGGLTATATSCVLSTGQGATFEVGDYVRFGTGAAAEMAFIEDISTDTLTLERGALGTTAAIQSAGTDIYHVRVPQDIKGAARDVVVYRYLHKDQIGSRVTVIDNGVVSVEDLDPRVQKTIDRHKVKFMPRAV